MDEVPECKKFNPHSATATLENEAEEICPVDLPPQEVVLSIDHILEQIFGLLDTSSLFTCRLVSHRFLNFAQRPLENRIRKSFSCISTRKGSSLTQLTQFLEQSASAAEAKGVLFSFPCTDFRIYGPPLGNGVIQKFLNAYGSRIQNLKMLPCRKDDAIENICMKQLQKLLTVQAPHLESLSIALYPTVEWQHGIAIEDPKNANPRSLSCNDVLLQTDPEFQQISTLPRTSNLKILEISGHRLAKTMGLLFQLSPKLQQVYIRQGVIRKKVITFGDYRHMLYPVNRVHLLKSLTIRPCMKLSPNSSVRNYVSFDIDTMEKISLEQNLKLTHLEIDFRNADRVWPFHSKFESKVVTLINRILEGSKDSLERLSLRLFAFLRGIKIPSPMPKVRKIYINDYEGGGSNNKKTVFPKGFPFIETFPKLTRVKLGNKCFLGQDCYCQLLRYVNLGGDEEGPNV